MTGLFDGRLVRVDAYLRQRQLVQGDRVFLVESGREAQKLESLGRLAGGVAHDFNNLLVVIVGYCDLLLRELRGQERASGRLAQIQKAAQKAPPLTRQLLAFSRRQILNPAVVDLRTVVQDMEQMLRRLVGEDVLVKIVLPAGARRPGPDGAGLRVIFTSGYTRDVIAHRGVLEAGIDYLAKPFSPDDLAKRVRAALDR